MKIQMSVYLRLCSCLYAICWWLCYTVLVLTIQAPIFVTHHSQRAANYDGALERKNEQITLLKEGNRGVQLTIDTASEQQRAAAEQTAIDAKVRAIHYMQAQYILFVM
jgi:hypothetical protein